MNICSYLPQKLTSFFIFSDKPPMEQHEKKNPPILRAKKTFFGYKIQKLDFIACAVFIGAFLVQ